MWVHLKSFCFQGLIIVLEFENSEKLSLVSVGSEFLPFNALTPLFDSLTPSPPLCTRWFKLSMNSSFSLSSPVLHLMYTWLAVSLRTSGLLVSASIWCDLRRVILTLKHRYAKEKKKLSNIWRVTRFFSTIFK